MSDPKHEGNVGPNDPAYYAPREMRERAASGQPDTVLQQAAEWRPRLAAEEGPPLQPLGRPQRREQSEVFTKAVAQAMQEAMASAPVEAPSILRETSGRRALFNVVMRFTLAVAIAASIATIFVMAIPASQRPAAQSNDASSISAIWQSVKSSVLPAPPPKRAATLSAQERSGRANDPLPLGFQVGAPFPGAIVAINGLPSGARLTSGQRIANEWHVPASEISGVSVIPPGGFVGQMLLTAELRDGDGAALVASSTRLSWMAAASVASPPPSPPPAVVAVAAPAAPAAAAPPPQAEIVRSLDPKEISSLVKRGQDLLASGDIQSARLLLLRGAEARDGRSAFLLGTTYDPVLLKQIGANGPLADAAQARNWYHKAKEWGEPEAQRQLEALALPR